MGGGRSMPFSPLSENKGLRAGDAIIAATATENGLTLCTANIRHYKPIKELKLKVFKPS